MSKSDRWIPSELKLIPIIMLCLYVCTPMFLLEDLMGRKLQTKTLHV